MGWFRRKPGRHSIGAVARPIPPPAPPAASAFAPQITASRPLPAVSPALSVAVAPTPSAPPVEAAPEPAVRPARRTTPVAGADPAPLAVSGRIPEQAQPWVTPVSPTPVLSQPIEPLAPEPGRRVELGFRDGTTAVLLPGSAPFLALEAMASALRRRD